ncbi:MAG: hypothetical protein V4724_02380 [Pseudomonadota bacterium]
MLQEQELRQRFIRVERAIGEAAQACSAERNLPSELRDCIQKLDRQSDAARQAVEACDEAGIRKMVGALELLGDRAKRVCSSVTTLTPQMKSAVKHVHDELSELKHELH